MLAKIISQRGITKEETMSIVRFCRGKVMPMIKIFIIVQFLLGFLIMSLRNYECEEKIRTTKQELELTKQSKLIPVKPDERGGISLPLKHYEKAYPYGTQPADENLMLHIAGWTIKEATKKKWFNEGEADFLGCPNLEPWMRCSYSSNRAAVNYSKALLFHARYIETDDMPTDRPLRQKWIFYENEPPPLTWKRVDLGKYKDMFNITSTFTMDSNIPLLFRTYQCLPKNEPMSDRTNYAQGKSAMAVWFVSDCKTQSRREYYAVELSKHINVDTFGKCGTARCPVTEDNDGEDCIEKLLSSTYKFYLAFEDSFCEGYITEQFGRLLSMNIIPVVMGSVEVATILPPGSYIDVRDFPSPKALATHLKKVDADDALYNQYILAKNAVKCRHPFAFKFSCQLCRYLHVNRYMREQVFDVAKFWSEDYRCKSPNTFYRGVADGIVSAEPERFPSKQQPVKQQEYEEEEEAAPRPRAQRRQEVEEDMDTEPQERPRKRTVIIEEEEEEEEQPVRVVKKRAVQDEYDEEPVVKTKKKIPIRYDDE